jgi:hypothetical protein
MKYNSQKNAEPGIGPSRNAVDAVHNLAEDAARWMAPFPEDYVAETNDVAEIAQRERSGWEQTDQFNVSIYQPLDRIVEKEVERLGKELTWEEKQAIFMEPSLDLFWEVWEEKADFYEAVNKALDDMAGTNSPQ